MVSGLRYLAALALLALGGCASSGYDGYYSSYPAETYYDEPYYYGDPYYNGAFGYGSVFDDDFDHHPDRYFHPADRVTCDRVRDICYDRYGPSYTATMRYLGEREANAAFHRYGNKIVLFSPEDGVTCDRRKHICSDAGGVDQDMTIKYFRHHADSGIKNVPPPLAHNNGESGNAHAHVPSQPDEVFPVVPGGQGQTRLSNNDKNAVRPIQQPEPQAHDPMNNDNNDDAPSNVRPNRRIAPPTMMHNAPGNDACPPIGCSGK